MALLEVALAFRPLRIAHTFEVLFAEVALQIWDFERANVLAVLEVLDRGRLAVEHPVVLQLEFQLRNDCILVHQVELQETVLHEVSY